MRPHTFIYYFADDDDDAARPRGIIDLEYYTEVAVVNMCHPDGAPDGRALRLHAPTMPMRDFFFKVSSVSSVSNMLDMTPPPSTARALTTRVSCDTTVAEEETAPLTRHTISLPSPHHAPLATSYRCRRRVRAAASHALRRAANLVACCARRTSVLVRGESSRRTTI